QRGARGHLDPAAADPPGRDAHGDLLDHRHPAAVRRAAADADHERRDHLGVHPEHVRLRLRVPVQRHRHGGSAGRDHRGLRLPPLGDRAGSLLLDGEAPMTTSHPTHDTARPDADAASGRRRAASRRAAAESRTGARDAGRKPTTTILVTAILVNVALYFLVPVYWVVVNATKSTEDLFGTSGFWFGESFQLVENLRSVLSANDGIFPRWGLNSVLYAGVGSVLATYFATAAGYALA